jgi:hypothetical protein
MSNIELDEDFFLPKVSDTYEDASSYWGDAWWDIYEDYYRENDEREN